MLRLSALLAAIVVLAGCASQSITMLPPGDHELSTERTVASNFDESWETMVRNLSKSFFVINNIEKESRIINVSFSTSDPGDFVDCGTSILTVNDEDHRIAYTEDATYPFVYHQGAYRHVGSASREVSLNGRVNIYMEPVSEGRTRVSANAKYVVETAIERFTKTGQRYETDSATVTLQSNSPTKKGNVECVSRGTLEDRILDMAAAS